MYSTYPAFRLKLDNNFLRIRRVLFRQPSLDSRSVQVELGGREVLVLGAYLHHAEVHLAGHRVRSLREPRDLPCSDEYSGSIPTDRLGCDRAWPAEIRCAAFRVVTGNDWVSPWRRGAALLPASYSSRSLDVVFSRASGLISCSRNEG